MIAEVSVYENGEIIRFCWYDPSFQENLLDFVINTFPDYHHYEILYKDNLNFSKV